MRPTFFGLIPLVLFLGSLAVSFTGAVLAFKASVFLGIAALIIEPVPFLLGLAALLGHPNVAQHIATALGLS